MASGQNPLLSDTRILKRWNSFPLRIQPTQNHKELLLIFEIEQVKGQ